MAKKQTLNEMVGQRVARRAAILGIKDLGYLLKRRNSDLEKILNGKKEMTLGFIERCASILNVSTDYLIGSNPLDLDDNSRELLTYFRQLDEEHQVKVISISKCYHREGGRVTPTEKLRGDA